MAVRVVRVGEDEWRRVRRVRLAALAADPAAFGSTLAREVAFDEPRWRHRLRHSAWFLAVDAEPAADTDVPAADNADAADGGVAGLACGIAEPGAGDERQLVSLWVRPDHRGHGVAAALVDAVADWASGQAARRLTLWVVDGNAAAAALYARAGFRPAGPAREVPGHPGRRERLLALPLPLSLPGAGAEPAGPTTPIAGR